MTDFADVAVLLFAGHWVGDYWVQTSWQAATKPQRDAEGRTACALHVTTYTITLAVFLLLGAALHLPYTLAGVFIALAVSAVTHYFADRRFPLRKLASLIGSEGYWDNGGAPFLDQAWHLGWLTVCAVLVATLP
jgi:hypothetical protein